MKKVQIRRLFIIMLVLLPLQHAAVGLIGYMRSEPWPAFVFPGFKNVYDSGDDITLRNAYFYAMQENEELLHIPTEEVFRGIPVSHHRGILRYQFDRYKVDDRSRQKFFSEHGSNWFRAQLTAGGYAMREDADTPLYLIWKKETFRLEDRQMKLIKSVPQDTVRITFNQTMEATL